MEITLQGCRNKDKLQYKNFEIFKNDSTWAENTKNNESNSPKGPHTPHVLLARSKSNYSTLLCQAPHMVCQQKCRTRSRRALPTRVASTTNGIQSCTISKPRVTELSLFSPVDGGFLLTCASCSRPVSSRACRDLEDHTFK